MTQTITIDGTTVERQDGSTVCIGYYEDADGKVVSGFAVPSGEYEVPDAVDSLQYVDSMADIPDIHADYRAQL